MARNYRDLFSHNVTAALSRLGKSQNWLAQETGLHQSQLNRWVRGITEPGIEAVGIIAEALGLTLDELFELKARTAPRVSEAGLTPELRAQIVAAAKLAVESALSGYLHSDENRRKIDEVLDRLDPELYFDIYEFVWSLEQAAQAEAEKEKRRKNPKPSSEDSGAS